MSVRDLIILGCSSQQPTRRRNHGAYLLRWNEQGFLFDPGEGTQRQFIFANVAPPCVNRIFISHFHGDHCLGLGSMLMRLNLDKVTHPIHCYYPASGKKYFDRLRFGTIYHETIQVIEHPISDEGIIHDDGNFQIEAYYLKHGVDNLGYRVKEADVQKFEKEKLIAHGIKGPLVRELEDKGSLTVGGRTITLADVGYVRKGDVFSTVIDTLPCRNAIKIAADAKTLLCEATYLEEHRDLARKHRHLTARQAAEIAKEAGVQQLILTHFSARYLDLSPFLEEARNLFPNTEVADDFKRFDFPR
ncbi:MAG: ribonuclease Z [Simkaniaceae bacterium]|nr:ribonuclease Z [Candidatus Sacchlamyda saccharinae]